jgi:hypothetical protein
MLGVSEAVALAENLYGKHVGEREDLDTLRRYVTGKQAMPMVVPSDAPREVHEMARISRINLIAIVVKALVESLYVDNFRAPDLPDNELPQLTPEQLAAGEAPDDAEDPLGEVWRAWQANKLDRGQGGLYRAVFTYGYGYVAVTPGSPYPVARAVSPRKMIAVYDDGEDYPEYALERRRNGYRLYDSEGVYDLRRDGEGRWSLPAEGSPHGLDYCPVIRYTSEDDLDLDDEPTPMGYGNAQRGVRNTTNIVAGEVAPLMTLQDQADFTTFTLKGAEWYSAYRQRWVVGWTPESRAQKVAAGASQMWTFDEDPEQVRVGEFGQTILDGYLRSRQETLRYGATLSQTPVHELIGELVNLSAEALAAAEAGRDRKVLLAKTCLGEAHEMLARTMGDLMGVEIPDDTETIWRDTSARAFGAVVDGLGKLAQMLGIPPEALWDRIPGVTRTDIRRWKELAQEGDALDRLTGLLDQQAASPAEPTSLPGGETRTPSGLIVPAGAAV